MEDQALILPKRRFNVLVIIGGIAIAVFFDWALDFLVVRRGMDHVTRWYISRFTCWAVLPVLYQYSARVEGRDFLLWKEKPQRIYFYIASIAILFMLTSFNHSISSIPRRAGFHDNYKVLSSVHLIMRSNGLLLLFTSFTAGITEELIIRGYVLPRLSLLLKSDYVPIIISSLFFSLWHFGYYNLSEMIFTFIFGLMTAVFYKKYKNIKILMIFHFLYDFVINL